MTKIFEFEEVNNVEGARYEKYKPSDDSIRAIATCTYGDKKIEYDGKPWITLMSKSYKHNNEFQLATVVHKSDEWHQKIDINRSRNSKYNAIEQYIRRVDFPAYVKFVNNVNKHWSR